MNSEKPDGAPQEGSATESGESAPLILIPVTAQDVFRRKVRIISWISAALVAAILITWIIWKRSTDPIKAQEAFDSGQRLLKVAQYSEAALSFDRALSFRSDLVDAYLLRGRAYVGLNDGEKAVRDFSKVLELKPRDARAYTERGNVYLSNKNPRNAIGDFTKAIEIEPAMAEAYNLRGIARRELGEIPAALADFDKAVQVSPDADNYFQRASTYQLMGDHQRALADFDKVIEFKPDIAHTYFARARSRRALGDEAGALADHRKGRYLDGR
jgi:tetratricopeptide (TPR) repeat protein